MKKNVKKPARRANGEGSIFPRKDGSYGAAISCGKDENGKRIRIVVIGKTEAEVREKMEQRLQSMKMIPDEDDQPIVISAQTSIEDFTRDYRVNGITTNTDISSRTADNYVYALSIFEKYFTCTKPVDSIGAIDVIKLNQFYRYLENLKNSKGEYTYAAATLRRIDLVVRKMYTRALKKKYLGSNPYDDIDFHPPKSKKIMPEIQALAEDDVRLVFSIFKKNKVVYPVLSFMLQTGVRTEEALGLKWRDIDFQTGMVHICRAMTKEINFDENGIKVSGHATLGPVKALPSDRDIPMTDQLIAELTEWRGLAPMISKTKTGADDFVFGNKKNDHWTYDGFHSSVMKYINSNLDDGSIEGFRLHQIRHTVATLLAENGSTMSELMQLLGHAQAKTTMKYIDRVSDKRTEKNREGLSKCIGGLIT